MVEGGGLQAVPDSTNFILNEMGIHEMGLKTPLESDLHSTREKRNIGVVKDFHLKIFIEDQPMILFRVRLASAKYIKTTAKDAPKAIATHQIVEAV
jgi:hypothetical protein